mgnify:CR=1 FL=1
MKDVYKDLAQKLDGLPQGYPATESGVELKILQKIYSPEEAEMALKIRPIPETAEVIAQRLGKPIPEMEAILEVRAQEGNVVEIKTHEGSGDVSGLSVLVGPPLFDVKQEITVRVNGEQLFKGAVQHTFSTLMLTLVRNDPGLLFDARIDL